MRRRTYPVASALAAIAVTAAGCGSDDHPNDPRPAKPIEVTARVDNDAVEVSPSKFGAGLVVFTISNQSDGAAALTVDGPVAASSQTLEPGAVSDDFKVDLQEGTYEVTGGEESQAKPQELVVGPARPSAQDELLLP
jgi:hypothetical protein